MESGPLSSPEFKEFAKDVVLFCHITARIPGRKYDGLLSEKGGRGFPYLVFMDAEGNVIGKPNGRSVAAFRQGAERASSFCALKAKEDRTTEEEIELLNLEIQFGTVSADDARQRADALGDSLSDAQRSKLDEALEVLARKDFDKQIMKILEEKNPRSQAEAKKVIGEIGPQFYEFYQQGKRTSDDPQAGQTFYSVLLQYGLEHKQAGPARAGYEGLNEMFGNQPGARAKLDQLKAQVEALEGGE